MKTIVPFLSVFFLSSILNAQITKWVPVTYTDNSTKQDQVSGGFNKIYPPLANVSGGFGMAVPLIKNVEPALWKGIHYREGFIGISMYNAKTTFKPDNDTTISGSSKYFTFDFTIPLRFLATGERSIYGNSGVLLIPNVGLFYQAITVGGETAGGFGIAPEFSLQLPYSLISLKLNCGYSIGGGKSVSGYASATKGFTFFPQISFQLDGLTAWHGIKKTYTGTSTEGQTSYNTTYKYEGYGITTVTKEPMKISYWTQDWHTKTYDPFYALYIRGEIGSKKADVPTYNYGLGLSSRRYIFLKDVFLSFGQYAIKGFSDVPDAEQPPDLSLFKGTVKTIGLNANFGIDALFVLKRLLFASHYHNIDDGILSTFTPYRSVFLGMGISYLIPFSESFTNQNITTDADSYFANHPDIVRDAKTDPTDVKPGLGINLFLQYEIASLGITLNMSMQQKMGAFAGVGFVYHLPIAKQEYPGWLYLWKRYIKKE